MIDKFFKTPNKIKQINESPLGTYINSFAKCLHDQGYSPSRAQSQIRVITSFGKWLQQQSLETKDIDTQKIDKFLKYRKKFVTIQDGDRLALKKLIQILHEMGILEDKVVETIKNDYQLVEDDFKNYLSQERELAPTTVIYHLPIVNKFLFERFGTDPISFKALNAAYITGFIQRHAHDLSNKRAKLMVTVIRGFLRYLFFRGEIATDLSICVPTVPDWKLAAVPRYLQPEQVEAILKTCNRQTPLGKRNYAILLIMARLGLRACEVIALKLEDMEWETGHFTIRAKGGNQVRFPLPKDVGEAIVEYLKNGRPHCLTRHIFICQRAPIKKFAHSSDISSIVRRALKRAGIDAPHMGAHLFRHTLATKMLRQGASLTEIGELLRHRSPNTTTIYAKVDTTALKELAPAWPGGEI